MPNVGPGHPPHAQMLMHPQQAQGAAAVVAPIPHGATAQGVLPKQAKALIIGRTLTEHFLWAPTII